MIKPIQLKNPDHDSESKPVDYEFNILVCHLLFGNFEYLFVSIKKCHYIMFLFFNLFHNFI